MVKDKDGPLPGATVMEKGTAANGVSTTVDGKFTITLRGSSNVLTVRGVSYISQDVNVAGKSNITVTLVADSKGLEEVVVVGYGTQKKINVTGAVSSVSRTEIQQTPSASIQNALTGKLPGFFSQQRSGRPGADAADFFVRGVSTPSGNQSPLILVDDIITNYNDFANIDPNEVQSISILKDAATTAPYGIEGANGVILVTTRRGAVGAPRINFRTEFGLQTPTQRPHFLDAYNTALLRNEAGYNDARITGGTALTNYVPEFSAADLQKFQDGSDPYGHPNVDWYNTLFKKFAGINKSNFDLSGGTENVQYFVSLGYEDQGGMMRNFNTSNDLDNNYAFNRFNFRSNLDIKASKSLSFKVDLSGNNTITNSPKFNGGSGSAETAAFYEVFNFESLTPYSYPIYNPDGSFGAANPNKPAPSNNIIGRLTYGGYSRVKQNLLNVNLSAIEKMDYITKGLSAKLTASVSNSEASTRTTSRANFPSFYYDPVAGTYTPRDATIYRIDPFATTYAGGSPRRQSSIQASLNYNNSFGKHNVSVLVLANQSTIVTADAGDTNYIPTNLRGAMSRVQYNFNNKYNVEFDGSYNGTDKFAAAKRYGFFPAVSAGWTISEEGFVKNNLKFIDLLKFRGSYGVVGSDNLPNGAKNSYEENYIRGGIYSFGQSNTPYTSIVPSTLANNSVTWEKEKKLNLGADFSFFHGRLYGLVEVFKNRRYDILTALKTVPHYYGVPTSGLPPENLGIVENHGYEFELGYNGKAGKDFTYRLKGSFSYAKNKIIEIDEVPPLYPWQEQTGRSIGEVTQWIWDGYYSAAEAADPKVPKYIGSAVAGVAGTTLPGFLKYRDLNGDGVITDLDKAYVGHANLPTTIIGFNTGLTYKRISLNVLMQSALNYDVQVNYAFATPFKGNLQAIHLDRWQASDPGAAQFPTLVTNFHGTYQTAGNYSTFWSISGNYLRIKSVELGYQLPERWANAVGMKGIRLYANGYNLYTWSKSLTKYGLDPEVLRGAGDPGAQGVYPQSAIFNLGVNVSIK
ncbi:TonB-dependent receptor [Mucilaginibacter mali]|uniref:TonB-dependent receptor n=1 Tax=Mucilaginibacter mali TaxID=2740462 RepID=A0A7D4UJA4_9SPHI|nr:TonB-dependent receptor [Mucilaginibacter mali]QKJ28782.1 TonB-dependent receptor [Mucilaginibacter mali]